jgi:hypothetical protein
MTAELQIARLEFHSTGAAYHRPPARMRNLGSAILLVAIEDYRGTDEELHLHAELFLYPQKARWQTHYDWVVSLADGFDPAWLRSGLDRLKSQWDVERFARMRSEATHATDSQTEKGVISE